MNIKAQKGTKDILPTEVRRWQFIEQQALKVFDSANYKEIRTPIFEATQLFARGVGDSTDIVNKEMYTFEKNHRSLTLRPENTASVVRAFIEHNFERLNYPVKLWYKGPMFRYERPQAGRQRQFHQIGVECFGIESANADAEVILTAINFLNNLNIFNLVIEINSIGCKECRMTFKSNLKNAIKHHLENLCDDCKIRFDKNPLRILDCKDENCIKILNEDHSIKETIEQDYICDDCKEHFQQLQSLLNSLDIDFTINKKLVRGLDYYNRTVFEIKSNHLGAQNAVLGGGRYDSLVETLGGKEKICAVGWAAGVERLNSLIDINIVEDKKLDYFVISHNNLIALKLVNNLRKKGFTADFDYKSRKIKKQIDKACKIANYAIFVCEDELNSKYLTVKNLSDFSQQKIPFLQFDLIL